MDKVGRPPWSTRFSAQRLLGDLLERKWIEGWVSFVALLVTVVWALQVDPLATHGANLHEAGLDLSITLLLGLGLAWTVLCGGIDISVVGTYAITSVTTLVLIEQHGWPVLGALLVGVLLGVLIGSVNALLVVVVGTRPLLTTLVVLVILRSVVSIMANAANSAPSLNATSIDNPLWIFLDRGAVLGLPIPVVTVLVVVVVAHLIHSRTRIGSHWIATGASEQAAVEAGIRVRRVKSMSYIGSGVLASLAGMIQAVRFEAISDQIGAGQEFALLATLVLAGMSFVGGLGTVPRIVVASTAVIIFDRTLINTSSNAYVGGIVLAAVLLVAMMIDVKFKKNKHRIIESLTVAPTGWAFDSELPDFAAGSGSFWALNDRLTHAEPIGLDLVEGPEDCAVDSLGRVYCGDRRGWIWQFDGLGMTNGRVFSRPGGQPLGMVFDHDENLIVCVTGRGITKIDREGVATTLVDHTRRSLFSLRDDRRVQLPDDLDITPDGKIWFSEPSKRFTQADWMLDVLEGRPNGRLVCHDPATGKTRTVVDHLFFPNGVCSTHEKDAVLIASTTRATVYRYFTSGPQAGQLTVFVDGLPGYLDNINRSADGGYWLGFVGTRNPAFDLAQPFVRLKRRMAKAIPQDEWMFPNLNQGCLVKLAANGTPLEVLWDESMKSHSMVTSMREFGTTLYVGGLTNNRIGKVEIAVQATCECGQSPCRGSATGREIADAVALGLHDVSAGAGR